MAAQKRDQEESEHYEECPQAQHPSQPCRCKGINAADEAYFSEPPDMFEREWGSYTRRL